MTLKPYNKYLEKNIFVNVTEERIVKEIVFKV